MTALLLDTHALIWFAAGDTDRMPETVAKMIATAENDVYVSAASIWEIATKSRLGKLTGAYDIVRRPEHYVSELGMTGLQISIAHAALAGSFDAAHRDPFDRMLAAQGRLENLTIVSVDTALDAFDVKRVWAD